MNSRQTDVRTFTLRCSNAKAQVLLLGVTFQPVPRHRYPHLGKLHLVTNMDIRIDSHTILMIGLKSIPRFYLNDKTTLSLVKIKRRKYDIFLTLQ